MYLMYLHISVYHICAHRSLEKHTLKRRDGTFHMYVRKYVCIYVCLYIYISISVYLSIYPYLAIPVMHLHLMYDSKLVPKRIATD